MCIPPPPGYAIHYSCPSCGWKKVTTPKSDHRIIGVDCFMCCPQCGNELLDQHETVDKPASSWLRTLLGGRSTE